MIINLFEAGARQVIIPIGDAERKRIDFVDFDKDGNARDLDDWTLTPIIYHIGTNNAWKTGALAGEIVEVDFALGTFYFLNAVAIVATTGAQYNLRIKFVKGDITYEKPGGSEIIIEVR